MSNYASLIIDAEGDLYFDEDMDEYNCVHFAKELSLLLDDDGIEHEIQKLDGKYGMVTHAWVYVPSEKLYYDAWTTWGVSDWKMLGYWDYENEQNPNIPHRFEEVKA